MRIPRWLLTFLIVVTAIALAVVPGWLWVELPQRTAAAFIEAIEVGDTDRANRLLVNSNCKFVLTADGTLAMDAHHRNVLAFPDGKVRCVDRQLRDLAVGRQQMVIFCGDGYSGVKFHATWSEVTIPAGSGHLKL